MTPDGNGRRAPVLIAVASGKGGVGKSTVAVNLALALRDRGLRVGLADADLYGPDAAHMLGVRRQAEASHVTVFAAPGSAGARLEAMDRHGLRLASGAMLMGERQAFSAGAPLAQLLVQRLLYDTNWGELDRIIIDLPPGTADVQHAVFGRPGGMFVLLVVTPQLVAHLDAHRLLTELERLARLGVVVLGGVENMAGQLCPACGELTELFPAAPPDRTIWSRTGKLASVPFSAQAAAETDQGNPVLLSRAILPQVAAFELLAAEVESKLAP